MHCIIALLLGTALLRGAGPQFPAAAFYWDATHIAIVVGQASDQIPPRTAMRLPDRNLRPPWGEMFGLPEISNSNGVKSGESFDINLTGNFWVRATVNSFIYNKSEYQEWILAIATIEPDNQERYAAAIQAKLYVFLAARAARKRVSDSGQIRNP